MACADCIGQNGGGRGYIFVMRLRDRLFLLPCLLACAFLARPVLADSGDVEGSHDYPGWTHMPGFEITDYDEDNPSVFTFAVSRPLPIDANHLEAIPVEGHRFVIRYEWAGSGAAPSLLKSQRFYEKLAAAAGYTVEKSGAVGNVTETFHLDKDGRQVWVFLNPGVRVNVLTIMESRAATSQTLAAATSALPPSLPAALSTPPPAPAPVPAPQSPVVPPPAPTPSPTPDAAEDPIGTALISDGRVVLPLTFLPGKPDMDAASQPVIDRVVAILKLHPELSLTIEGHTDLTGDEDYNLTLSKERAQTVRNLLIAGHIRSKRLVATGLGGTQPVADEGTAVGREKNRRIELVVRKSPTKQEAPPKEVTQDVPASPPVEPAGNSSPSFHAPAPDGVNYYPAPATAPPPSSSGSRSR